MLISWNLVKRKMGTHLRTSEKQFWVFSFKKREYLHRLRTLSHGKDQKDVNRGDSLEYEKIREAYMCGRIL